MRRYAVVFMPLAERQFAELYDFVLDASGVARAERFVGAIVEDCLSLAHFPERGVRRDDVRPNLRTKGYARRVTIAFSVDHARSLVAILGVFYGGQDFEQALRDPAGDL